MKKNKKGTKGIKGIIKSILYLIVGLYYVIRYVLHFIDKDIPKIFMKTPRLFRQVVIYSMVVLSILCFVGRNEEMTVLKETTNEIATVVEDIINNEEVVEEIVEEDKCDMSGIECSIYYEAKEQGLTEEQTYMVLAISKLETGRWTSDAYKFSNNIGGIMTSKGLKNYSSIDDGIADMVAILKQLYFDKGLDTLEKIQPKYCPIDAENDPNGLNNYWLKNTKIFYNEYLGGK